MSGLEFNFTYANGTSWEQIIAFETAGLMWSDYMTDNMMVNIHVEVNDSLPDNVIGGALPAMVSDVNYTNFRNAYQDDITSLRDQRSFDSLSLLREGSGGLGPNGSWEKFEARIDFGEVGHMVEDSSELNMTRANAKALGLIAGDDSSLDGYIMMNDLSDASVNWDYNVNSASTNSLDFLSTAVHEVGHVLGFVSGVDKYDAVKFSNENNFWSYFGNDYNAAKDYLNEVVDYANPLDLFRYSYESLALGNGNNVIDMSVGTNAYFGPGMLWDQFATGKEQNLDGDGFQASHWKQRDNNSQLQGIMDPLMKLGTIRRISDRDLRAMEAIGYDVNFRANTMMNMISAETNWQPVSGIGTSIDTLYYQTKEHIARSTYSNGEASWVDWWMSTSDINTTDYMTFDRTSIVQDMIARSKVYEGRRSRSGGSWQEAYFMEFSWQEFNLGSIASAEPVVVYLDSSVSFQEVFTAIGSDNLRSADTEFNNKLEVVTAELNLLEFKEEIKFQAKASGMNDSLSKDDSFGLEDSLNSNKELLVIPLS